MAEAHPRRRRPSPPRRSRLRGADRTCQHPSCRTRPVARVRQAFQILGELGELPHVLAVRTDPHDLQQRGSGAEGLIRDRAAAPLHELGARRRSHSPSVAPPAACYASTSPNAPRSRTTPKPTSTPSPPNSTGALDKPSASRHHHKHSTPRCDEPLNPQPTASSRRQSRRAVRNATPERALCAHGGASVCYSGRGIGSLRAHRRRVVSPRPAGRTGSRRDLHRRER